MLATFLYYYCGLQRKVLNRVKIQEYLIELLNKQAIRKSLDNAIKISAFLADLGLGVFPVQKWELCMHLQLCN